MSNRTTSNQDQISNDLSELVANISLQANAPSHESAVESSTAPAVHTLHLVYPACDLLPTDVSLPDLVPPLHAILMDHPPIAKQILGIDDTSFSIRVPVKTSSILPPAMPFLPHLAFLATMARSTAAPGRSTLKVVRYWNSSSQAMVYKLILINEADLHIFEAAPVFELDEGQFNLLQACGEHFEWLKLLQGLVLRTSYRAVYHVREQLTKSYGGYGTIREEQVWAAAWASEIGRLPANNDESTVMQAVIATKAFVEQHAAWQALDVAVTDAGAEQEVHSMTVFRLVIEQFERCLYGIDFYQSVTPRHLYNALSCQANIVTAPVGVDLHIHLANLDPTASWQQFLKAWLRRTVNFVYMRRRSNKDHTHAGIQRHGLHQFYNPAEWEQEADTGWDGEDDNATMLPRAVREIDQMVNIANLNG